MLRTFRCIYEEFDVCRTPNWWTGVDVKREDGLLQHGTVVDASSSGLVVDMGCAGQRQKLVQYGVAFASPRDYLGERNIPCGSAVLVLLRDTSDGPWIWQPATFVERLSFIEAYRAYHELVLVALHGIQKVVVAVGQLRKPLSSEDLQDLAIQQGDYVRCECALPDYGGWRPASDSPVWQLAARAIRKFLCTFRPLFVDGNRFVYIQLASEDELNLTILKRIMDGAQGTAAKYKEAKGVEFWGDGWRCCTFPRGALDAVKLHHVPAIVLQEIFEYSSSMDRVQHRRVCRWFDEILTETHFKDIVIHCGICPANNLGLNCRRCGTHGVAYAVIASIVKCLTRSVKYIALTDDHPEKHPSAISLALQVLQSRTTLGLTGHRSLVVVAGNCELFSREIGEGRFGNEVKYLAKHLQGAGICSTLLLHQCTVKLSRSGARVRVSGVISASSAEVDLWNAVEKSVPAVDVAPISTWVASAALDYHDRMEITEALIHFAVDPRVRSADNFLTDFAGLDVTKLSVLRRYVLSLLVPPNGPNVFQVLPFVEHVFCRRTLEFTPVLVKSL